MAKYNKKLIKRKQKITFRVTKMERELLERSAKFCHTSLSNYVRVIALQKELPEPIHLTEGQHQILMDLKNLLQNRLTKSANLFNQNDPRFANEIRALIYEIQTYLKENRL